MENMRRYKNSDGAGDVAVLSVAEGQVLHLISCGFANKEIAHALETTTRTIESYIAEMLRGLGFANRVHLARWAYLYPLAAHGAACEINLHLHLPGCACPHPQCAEAQSAIRRGEFVLARAAAL